MPGAGACGRSTDRRSDRSDAHCVRRVRRVISDVHMTRSPMVSARYVTLAANQADAKLPPISSSSGSTRSPVQIVQLGMHRLHALAVAAVARID